MIKNMIFYLESICVERKEHSCLVGEFYQDEVGNESQVE